MAHFPKETIHGFYWLFQSICNGQNGAITQIPKGWEGVHTCTFLRSAHLSRSDFLQGSTQGLDCCERNLALSDASVVRTRTSCRTSLQPRSDQRVSRPGQPPAKEAGSIKEKGSWRLTAPKRNIGVKAANAKLCLQTTSICPLAPKRLLKPVLTYYLFV